MNEETEHTARADGPRQKILIVEDDDEHRFLMQKTLVGSGYDVIDVPGGQRALLYAQMSKPYLILLDIGLASQMDGWEVLRQLRASEETAAIPVMIVSAGGDEARMKQARAAGADDYLIKPFRIPELLMRVQRVLSSRADDADKSEERPQEYQHPEP